MRRVSVEFWVLVVVVPLCTSLGTEVDPTAYECEVNISDQNIRLQQQNDMEVWAMTVL